MEMKTCRSLRMARRIWMLRKPISGSNRTRPMSRCDRYRKKIIGFIYYLFPKVTQSALCKIQFILFNIGLPIMLAGLAFDLSGFNAVVVVAIGGIITSIAILIFTINVLIFLKNVPDFKKHQEE